MSIATITKTDAARLVKLEQVVENGKKAFLEVGNALKEISESKLYRETHKTFAAYVEERFEIKRTYAHNLIESAKVAGNVQHAEQITNPRQAVEVAKAPPEKQQAVVDRAAEIAEERGKAPTAAIISEARKEVMGTIVDDDEYEEVEDDPVETRTESISKLKTAIKSHNAAMMRMVDDLHGINPDASSHKAIHTSFRAIHTAVEDWK